MKAAGDEDPAIPRKKEAGASWMSTKDSPLRKQMTLETFTALFKC